MILILILDAKERNEVVVHREESKENPSSSEKIVGTTVSAASAGAAIGAFGGPVGAVVGGGIGAVFGFVAGILD